MIAKTRRSARKNPLNDFQGYDLVGDIHGHADALHRLLHELEYDEVEGVFRHPERKMIFVGDFVDRGPQQRAKFFGLPALCDHQDAVGWFRSLRPSRPSRSPCLLA